MALEKYTMAASLGLYVFFVAEIITIFIYMTSPPADEFVAIEPEAKIFQFISLSIAPAMVMTGLSFLLAKRYGSRPISIAIMGGGVILLVGMFYANTILEDVEQMYLVDTVTITPPLFMGISIPIIVLGAILFRIKKERPKKRYFDDRSDLI
jgi:hypothetical protein|tara:strand:+ start:2790 stop:3245 length:456 start_codon:yes stop_codon:yes gene_type:complete